MERKFTVDGNEVRVMGKANNKFIVCNIYEDIHGDEYVGECADDDNPYFIEKLFDKPPLEKKNKEIAELDKQRNILNMELTAIRDNIRKEKQGYEEILKRLQKYDALRDIDLFLAGKVTHYVFSGEYSRPELLTQEEARCKYDSANLRMLGLYGKLLKGETKMVWKLSDYSDGSGSKIDTIPCTSYEEATAQLQTVLTKETNQGSWRDESIINLARKHNLDLPEDYEAQYCKQVRKGIDKDIKKAEDNLSLMYEKREKQNSKD